MKRIIFKTHRTRNHKYLNRYRFYSSDIFLNSTVLLWFNSDDSLRHGQKWHRLLLEDCHILSTTRLFLIRLISCFFWISLYSLLWSSIVSRESSSSNSCLCVNYCVPVKMGFSSDFVFSYYDIINFLFGRTKAEVFRFLQPLIFSSFSYS